MNLRTHRLCATAIAVLCAGGSPALAQVRYFERPPSVDELRSGLARERAPLTRGLHPQAGPSRSIQWQGETPAGADAASAKPAEAPAPAAAPGGPAVAVPIQFELGSSAVRADSMPFLESIAALLDQDRTLSLVVEGHTDASGAYRNNMVLSWDRALAVYKVLVQRFGIDPSRLRPLGLGPTAPMPGTEPLDPINRRVQFRTAG